MKHWGGRLFCAIASLGIVLGTSPGFAGPPTPSSDIFQTTLLDVTPNPINACVIQGTSTASGIVLGAGFFTGSTFTSTSTFNQNICTNKSHFAGMINVTGADPADTITFSVIGIATGPATAFANFQATGGTGAFPQGGVGTVTQLTETTASFDGKYHFHP